MSRSSTDPRSSTSTSKRFALDPLNAHERHQLRYSRIAESYKRGTGPPRPQSKTELDVLKERHQFIRTNDDPSTLSWEDQLALKYYNSLFREYAIVNLKHYKTGQIACRWRTENELLQGIGHLSCASMRCRFHEPDPNAADNALEAVVDPEAFDKPLVDTVLSEHEMQFGYVEAGEKRSALVKVVLCKDCGRKLRYGKDVAKQLREQGALSKTRVERKERSPRDTEIRTASPANPKEDAGRYSAERNSLYRDDYGEHDHMRSRRSQEGMQPPHSHEHERLESHRRRSASPPRRRHH